MFAWARKLAVAFLVIGVFFEDATQVEGVRCYECIECHVDNNLQVSERDCGKDSFCYNKTVTGDDKPDRKCFTQIEFDDYLTKGVVKMNGCVKAKLVNENGPVERCICDSDLCNGAAPPTSLAPTLDVFLPLPFALSSILFTMRWDSLS